MASFDREGLLVPQRFFPVTTLDGLVVGYAVRHGLGVDGHLGCDGTGGRGPLLLSIQELTGDMQTTAVNLTDANWRNGVWIASPAGMFLVEDADESAEKIAPGDALGFAKSGTRKVVRVGRGSATTVAIEVEGGSLDPEGDGHPKPIKNQAGTVGQKPLFLAIPE